MAIIQGNGHLLVDAVPTHTPVAGQSNWAFTEDTGIFHYFNGAGWTTIDLDAIAGITPDGNNTPITRGNTTQDVEPTAGEVPSPIDGDTAGVFLTDGVLEKWVYNGGWSKAYTMQANEAANLDYTASPTGGVVTSTSGTDATVPLVDGTNAGLMTPAQKAKLDLITITQAVDLDAMEALIATSLQSASDSTTIDFTVSGTDITGVVKISSTQGDGMTVTAEADGIRVVYVEAEPAAYISRAAATVALGAGKKFTYLVANLDGQGEGVEAWT